MKRSLSCFLWFCLACSLVHGQAFDKKNIMISVGIGMTNDVTMKRTTESFRPRGHAYLTPVAPLLQFKAEFAVQKYLSIGLTVDANGRINMASRHVMSTSSTYNIQFGAVANFHFYQLIADKLHRPAKMHADKWDIYTGFTIGNNFRADVMDGSKPVYMNKPYMNYHIGVNYRINEHWGLTGEAGYGTGGPMFSIGLVYYFGGPKKRKRPIRDF